MTTATKRIYAKPWDIATPPGEVAIIPIAHEIAATMLDGCQEEVDAIEIILEEWTKMQDSDPDVEFGLHIRRRYGLSAPEQKYIQDLRKEQRSMVAAATTIVKEIVEADKISPKEATELVSKLSVGSAESIAFAVTHPELMEKIDGIEDNQPAAAMKLETVLMRRFIKTWPEELTRFLHAEILEDLAGFYEEECQGSKGKRRRQSSSLTESLEQSESMSNLTGMAIS
jgi:hypothetical protein